MSQELIAKSAAEFFNVDLAELKSPCRKDALAWPRNICIYIAHGKGTPKSTIGRFWNRDRTVVYNSIRRVNERLESYPKKRVEYSNFLRYLETQKQKRKRELGI